MPSLIRPSRIRLQSGQRTALLRAGGSRARAGKPGFPPANCPMVQTY